MRIQESRRERADNVTADLESLMDRRRLMHGAGNRLEILRVKSEWINVAIPADDVERVMRHRHAGPARTILYQNFRVLFLVDRVELGRRMKITLGIRGAHFDLTLLVQIPFRNTHRPGGFKNQVIFFLHFIRHEPVSDAARDDNVIFGAVALLSEYGLERAAAFEDKDNFVGAAVLIILELAVRFLRPRSPRGHVLIKQNRNPSGVDIAAARNLRRLQMMMPERAVGDFLELLAFQKFDAANAGRRPQMIHDRVGFVESFRRNDVLVGDAFVLVSRRRAVAMEPDMMFPRHLAQFMVVRHCLLLLQVASAFLLFLKCFEERLEISFPKTLGAFALDDFEKQRRPVLYRLREYLEQITFVVAIDQNPESFQRPEIFVDVADAFGKRVVIS